MSDSLQDIILKDGYSRNHQIFHKEAEYIKVFDNLMMYKEYSKCIVFLDAFFTSKEWGLLDISYLKSNINSYKRRVPSANTKWLMIVLDRYANRLRNADTINRYGEEEYFKRVAVIRKIIDLLENGVNTKNGTRDFTLADYEKLTSSLFDGNILPFYEALEICKCEFDKKGPDKDKRDLFKEFVNSNYKSNSSVEKESKDYSNRGLAWRNQRISQPKTVADTIYDGYINQTRSRLIRIKQKAIKDAMKL